MLLVAALTPTSAIADSTDGTLMVTVQRDVNGNGRYDPGTDTPQEGIGIAVSDAGGSTVTGVTDTEGQFVLGASDKLTGGRYFVVAKIPNAHRELTPVPESSTFQALTTTVDLTSENQSVRMGVAARPAPAVALPPPGPPEQSARVAAPLFAVGDQVWTDTDKSGRQDVGEPTAGRVSVQLLNSEAEVMASTVTSASGHYLFDRLAAGTYSVRFAGIPTGFKFTAAGVGDHAGNSDADDTGVTAPFTLGIDEPNVRPSAAEDHVQAGYINPSVDAGITPLRYAISDGVWLDVNHDGRRQPDEPAATASVNLLTAEREPVRRVVTGPDGRYQFTGLRPGRYVLEFTALPAHRAFTVARAGTTTAADSDVNPQTGRTAVFELGPNAPDLVPAADLGVPDADFVNASLAAGLVGVYTIGDTVWRDNDGDGTLGPGDVGVPGVKISLLGDDEQVLDTKVSNRLGRFAFGSLPAGGYRLRFTGLPAGLVFAAPRVGNNPAVDSDADPWGLTPLVTLGDDNPADTAVDAGATTPGDRQVSATTSIPGPPPDVTLSSTGGVGAQILLGGLVLVLGGVASIVVGQRRRRA